MNRITRDVRVIVGALLLGLAALPSPAEAGSLLLDAQSGVLGRLGLNRPSGQPERHLKVGDSLTCKVATPTRLVEFGVSAAKNDDVTVRITGASEFEIVLKTRRYAFAVSPTGFVSRK